MLKPVESFRAKEGNGFTIVELLVVVVIVAVLSAIAIPLFLGQKSKAHEAQALAEVASAADLVNPAVVSNDWGNTVISGGAITTSIGSVRSSGGTFTVPVPPNSRHEYCLELLSSSGVVANYTTHYGATLGTCADAAARFGLPAPPPSGGDGGSGDNGGGGDAGDGEGDGNGGGASLIAPGDVTFITVTSDTGTDVGLEWVAPTTGGAVESYTVTVTRYDGTPMLETPTVTVTGLTASISGLNAATEYSFSLTAVNAAGSSSASSPVSVRAPASPSTLTKTFTALTAGQVSLNWTAADRATSYEVWRFGAGAPSLAAEIDPALSSFLYPDNGGAWTRIAANLPADQLSYIDTLTGNGKYVYVVKAINPRGATNSPRIPLTGTSPTGTLVSTLNQGSSLICKNASGVGGKYLLAVSETFLLSGPVNYSVGYQGGAITGTIVPGPSTYSGGIILNIPANVMQTITLRDAGTNALLASKSPSGTFGSQSVCP